MLCETALHSTFFWWCSIVLQSSVSISTWVIAFFCCVQEKVSSEINKVNHVSEKLPVAQLWQKLISCVKWACEHVVGVFFYKAFLNDIVQHEPKWASLMLLKFRVRCWKVLKLSVFLWFMKWAGLNEKILVKLLHLTDLHPVAPWHVSDKFAYTSVRWN